MTSPLFSTRRQALAIGLLTAGLHGLIAWCYPMPATFRKYGLAAEMYLNGELPSERLVDFSTLYFHLHVLAQRFVPAPGLALACLQMLLAAACVSLLFVLVERRLGPTWAAIAALTMAFDRHLLVYARILEPEVCLLFCLLGCMCLLDRRAGITSAWVAGGSAALCLAIRPTFLPAFLLVPGYYCWIQGDRGRLLRHKSVAFTTPVFVMLVLLALRAAAVTGDPWSPTMNPGTVFFEGNNPLSQGTSAIYPPVVLSYVRGSGVDPDPAHQHYRRIARAARGDLSIAEVNSYWSGLALDFIRDHPSRWLQLLGVKLKRAFHTFNWHDVPSAWQLEQRLSLVPRVPFALLSALALAGALFDVRRWRQALVHYSLAATQLAVMLVFYVSPRQRLVLLPALVYFAAVAARRLVEERAWIWALLVALLAIAFSVPDDAVDDESYRRRGWLEAEALLQQVRQKSRNQPLALHADLVVEAVAAAPWWLDWLRPAYFPRVAGSLEERVVELLAARPRSLPAADFDLAAMHLAANQPDEARRLLQPLAEHERLVYRGALQSSNPLHLIGRATFRRGDRPAAVELLKKAVHLSPGDPFILSDLIALGDLSSRVPLERYWGSLDAQYLLGRALHSARRPREASRALAFVVDHLEDFRDARILLAATLGAGGHLEDGVRHYLEATSLRSEPIVAGDDIASLIRAWADSHEGNPEARLYSAEVLHRHGFFAEALAMLESFDHPPELEQAVLELKRRLLLSTEHEPLQPTPISSSSRSQ